jgi:hypothetical protein
LSAIVPTPSLSEIVAFTGPARLTRNVSSISSSTSPLTRTVTVFVVSPATNVTVPDAAAKSPGAIAVPSAVA